MPIRKPSNITEYLRWLIEEHKYQPERIPPYYALVTRKIKAEFESGGLWAELNKQLKEFNDQYLVDTGFQLLMTGQNPEIYIKPFDSLVLKTFRKNILENENWPAEPRGGWVIPDDFTRANDILRTLFIVKYLDGVQFLTTRLEAFCNTRNINSRKFFEAREQGYYAAHFYLKVQFEIPKLTWDTELVEMSVEIQITTQLQETIRKLLHKYYAQRRQEPTRRVQTPWQWDYRSDEFAANYLGHILHYIEGMILEIGEKQARI